SSGFRNREAFVISLTQLSNEIIRLCCKEVSLDRIFDGYVTSSKQSLSGCISCCLSWKDHYLRAGHLHHSFCLKAGGLHPPSFPFLVVSKVTIRSYERFEVCDCQQQFGRWVEGNQTPLPRFSGLRGPQIARTLLEIEGTFERNLQILKAVKKGILDVKNTSWHDEYNRFRSGVKDLEVMVQNLINSAFETVRSVEQGVELLDVFQHLSAREAIKRSIDRKTVDVYTFLNEELNLVNKELSKKQPRMPLLMPYYTGQAYWVRALRYRIERPMEVHLLPFFQKAHFIPQIGMGEESRGAYNQLVQVLDEMVRKIFTDWTHTVDRQCLKRLDSSLMIRSQEKQGMLDVNFDKNLLKMFGEIHYWERLLFEIPYYVAEVYQRREDLRNLRENVLLVVRDYNRIIEVLSPEERGLFRERIRYLDKKIQPGLTKLLWSSKGASAFFITDCRLHANKVQLMVDDYKAANLLIAQHAKQISKMLLVYIDGKRVYKDLEFEEDQKMHRESIQRKMQNDGAEMPFNLYPVPPLVPQVQQHWVNYTENMDKLVEEAFRLNVKWSLQELSKAINGDSKTSPSPLFRVMVVLKNDMPGCTAQTPVEFSPTLMTLANIVNSISSHLIQNISIFKHLPDLLTRRKSQRDPIYSIVERDEEIKKIQSQISAGMTANATHLQNYLKMWDTYREIWELNKDSFIRRYQRLNPPVSSFDADIARYTEVANNVQKEETVLNIQFVLLDCSHLKFSLVQHCNEWQNKFTTLLNEMASNRLREVNTFLQENAENLSRPPQTLDELGSSLQLLETLQKDLPKTKGWIPPIHEQFAILEKYEVIVEDSVHAMLESLNGEWMSYQQCLIDSDTMLKKHKEKFKTGLIHSADEFKKKVRSLVDDFISKGLEPPRAKKKKKKKKKFHRQRLAASNSLPVWKISYLLVFLNPLINAYLMLLISVKTNLMFTGHVRLASSPPLYVPIPPHPGDLKARIEPWSNRVDVYFNPRNNIFLGEDIRRQLPMESSEFDDINLSWKVIMDRLTKDSNVLRGTHHSEHKMREENGRHWDLDSVFRKDNYKLARALRTPVSELAAHTDALSIVFLHLSLSLSLCLSQIGISGRFEAIGMFSADGEYVDFTHPVLLEGPVEAWLCDVEKQMRMTLKDILRNCRLTLKKMTSKRDKWVKEWPGQMVITSSQIQWTTDVSKSLITAKDRGDKKSVKIMKKKQAIIIVTFSPPLSGVYGFFALPKMLLFRTPCLPPSMHLITLNTRSYNSSVALRLQEVDNCVIRQTNTHFQYGYEYLGNSGRLVITPLTDRCFMTLTTALHLHRGGSPKGPAGTGKTETVKDLGKALGMYVIVVNCSEGLDYKSMGRMYSGLAQTGAWGCFDEFNRINIEVLSVVAQQILSILSALSGNLNRFIFEGRDISLVWSCGIFITMNPGYAGRTELPDNLKSMFRPISMVVPDSTLIAEIILFGEGFNNCKVLAKKVYTLYSLAVQQLSKQDHYDFGLRALTTLLRYAGKKRRARPDLSDEEILLMSMKDMNVAKLTSIDLPLFNGIVQDLFPGIETPVIDYGKLREMIESELKDSGLQVIPFTVTKVLQLYETKSSRHSTMIVGKTGSGKTVTWRVLQAVLSSLCRNGDPNYNFVKEYPLNPKAVTLGELYGEYDLNTNEWTDGVLSSLMRTACADERLEEKWIVFDGPVDTLWIESMNSVMDDNKVLTLINGERINMPEQVFFTKKQYSVYVYCIANVFSIGRTKPCFVFLGGFFGAGGWGLQEELEHLQRLFDKYIEATLSFKKAHCKELVPIAEYNGIVSLCKLFETLANVENGVNPMDFENYGRMIEMWFLFCMIWSICAAVDEDSRKRIDNFMREIEGSFPNKDTIYEYYVDPKVKNWALFEDKLPKGWRYPSNAPFYKIMVPTVDTVRYNFLVSSLISQHFPVLLLGPVGTGKTSIAQSALQSLDPFKWSVLTVNMSAQKKKNKKKPLVWKRSRPRLRTPVDPVELMLVVSLEALEIKTKLSLKGRLVLYSRGLASGCLQCMHTADERGLHCRRTEPGPDSSLIVEATRPRLGMRELAYRLSDCLDLQESQIKRIFGTMINQKLQDFEEEVKPIGNVITQATLEIYNAIVQKFLPTPAKIHYLFNLRDISKVFQGMLRSHKDFHDTKHSITRLWIHECFRVFSDRLVDQGDMETFVAILSEKLGSLFDQTFHNICPNRQSPLFGDFMHDFRVYEDLTDPTALKQFMETQLEDYNFTPGVIPMSLVLFKDAVEHAVCRIVRVIRQLRGNMLLIGIGGSGRQSLSRLASSICDYKIFQIEVTKHYRKQEFREAYSYLAKRCGENPPPLGVPFTPLKLTENYNSQESLQDSGHRPRPDRKRSSDKVQSALVESLNTAKVTEIPDNLFNFLIERVRNNLHIILCMSPVGDPFRNRLRQYPALVNCTTIDWFSEWPKDALLEVAEKYLEGMNLAALDMRGFSFVLFSLALFFQIHNKVALIFVTMHRSVVEYSRRMLLELRRQNYVTPINYLELVTGYKKLLVEKRKELGDEVNKLRNGLFKIDETRKKVEVMSLELEDAKKKVAEFQKQCEEYLVIIVQQKREADEQQKTVTANSEKIAAEEIKCKALAENAQKDLEEALPALEEAMKALESLNKKDMTEIKSYGRPPVLVETVMQAVMILRGSEPTWAEAKRQLGDQNFIKQLINFDKDNISDKVLKKIGQYCAHPDFHPEIIGRVSLAAKSLCMWVRAMEVYGRVFRVVEPKRARMNAAMAQLAEKQEALAEAQAKLQEVRGISAAGLSTTIKFKQKEKAEWDPTHTLFEFKRGLIVLSLSSPEEKGFRLYMRLRVVRSKRSSLNVQTFFFFFFFRWPLMIDPQGQALKWIKNMELGKGLKIIDLQMHDFLRTLENAVQFGFPVLLQNVQEELDPSLAPILNKSVTVVGGQMMIKLGDKDVEYSPDFRLYITTKLSNPHYTPEISTKTTIVNFAVKEQGLEAQLLGIVVRKERPELEEQKDSLVLNIAAGKKKIQELEDEILRLLNEATGSLLDDVQLVNTLQTSKVTATEVAEQLQVSEQTEMKIDTAREAYRPCAQRASILFFVLNDMGRIDPMYQFSLDAYIDLFNLSIEKSQRSTKLDQRIINLNDYHTYAVYRYTCRALFEHHKLLFSFQMCAKILEVAGKLNMDEYNFFLRGGVVLDTEDQMDNPCPGWLADTNWDNITELDKLTNFHGIMNSFEQYPRDWNLWYTDAEPENAMLPVCVRVDLLYIRYLDRYCFVLTLLLTIRLGLLLVVDTVVKVVVVVVDDSTAKSPLIFVLSSGVDPTGALLQLAEQSGMAHRFHALSLGQGQAPIATRMIKEGVKQAGNWVFLANCHLSLSWMPQLDKLVEQLQVEEPHPDFRIWLSSSPHPEFPISILQAGIKMTTEPPKGLKANMKRLYQLITDQQFNRCTKPSRYKKLLFALCFFHAVLLERKKFLQLGWNIIYGFNDSDFEVSENLLSLYLDEYEDTPWDALKYLIAGVNYGGHVTDDWDRRLLTTYINDYFCEQAVAAPFFKLSLLNTYYIPKDGNLYSYKEYINMLPNMDHPEMFGQHPNADIASQITEAQTLFDTLLSLQPQVTLAGVGGQSREEKVLELAADVRLKIPEEIDYEGTRKMLSDDPSPLNVVLLQEIQRYNALLCTMRSSLIELEKGIKGLVVMSTDLEETYNCIFDARVPPMWEK
uniref:Dynein axonemal heavy chain 2 n=1 Tax=Latimeria chalumnae TaxID=7897 RepID=H3A7W8_LATCH